MQFRWPCADGHSCEISWVSDNTHYVPYRLSFAYRSMTALTYPRGNLHWTSGGPSSPLSTILFTVETRPRGRREYGSSTNGPRLRAPSLPGIRTVSFFRRMKLQPKQRCDPRSVDWLHSLMAFDLQSSNLERKFTMSYLFNPEDLLHLRKGPASYLADEYASARR